MTITATQTRTDVRGCVQHADVFQHELVEEPPTATTAAVRRQAAQLTDRAAEICGDCPIVRQCLYNAIVEHDVSGFVAGTTEKQRHQIRRALGWTVEPENLDSMAGVVAANRQVDHDEIVRLRTANPHETLETLAHRMGCSLSTVKRHLRRHRQERTTPRPKPTRVRPTMEQVLTAARHVLSPQPYRRAA